MVEHDNENDLPEVKGTGGGTDNRDPQTLHSERGLFYEGTFEAIRSPLLPPEILAKYGEVVPDLPERMVQWIETESEDRRQMQQQAFEEAKAARRRGQVYGLSIALFGLAMAAVVGVAAAVFGSVAAAMTAGVVAIVGVGGPYAARLLANRWNRHESESKEE